MKRILGIDLGTTYSCIACMDENGRPAVIPNEIPELTTPSVVYFEDQNNIVVGRAAKNSARVMHDRVVEFVKRSMGDPTFAYEIDDREYTAEEVSSFILRKLVSNATQFLGEEIQDVVITCPAYFGESEREATRNAGRLAGLNVLHILNEPTAAAFCYGAGKQVENEVVLVYDLGGGTFDITVISIANATIQAICTNGDHNLGGKDWDDRLTNFFAERYMEKHPLKGDPRDDPYSLQELTNIAEEAKKSLSQRAKYPVMINHAGERVHVEVTREQFEDMTSDLLGRTIELTKDVLNDAKKSGVDRLDKVLLVGGQTKMPCVSQRLKEVIGIEPQSFDPDLAVAKGAALMGWKILAGERIREEIAKTRRIDKDSVNLEKVDSVTMERAAQKVSCNDEIFRGLSSKELAAMAKGKIRNVCSKGYGVVVRRSESSDERRVTFLIHRNSPVPVEVTQTDFYPIIANQENIHVQVMEQGGQIESQELGDNKAVCDGLVQLPPNFPVESPVHISFGLDDNGTLKIHALEPSSGNELRLEAKVDGVLADREVAQRLDGLLRKSVV